MWLQRRIGGWWWWLQPNDFLGGTAHLWPWVRGSLQRPRSCLESGRPDWVLLPKSHLYGHQHANHGRPRIKQRDSQALQKQKHGERHDISHAQDCSSDSERYEGGESTVSRSRHGDIPDETTKPARSQENPGKYLWGKNFYDWFTMTIINHFMTLPYLLQIKKIT